MLTRLEVDGFKNLVDFFVDFGPFTCIAGPNGVGKSNIFDAIRFLSLLCDHTLVEAALRVRANGADTDIQETSNIGDLFRAGDRHGSNNFRIAAEMIVEPKVTDDFGRSALASSTFLRYEIHVGYIPPSKRSLGRMLLLSEELKSLPRRQASTSPRFPSKQAFRDAVITNRRRSTADYISIRESRGLTEIVIHPDGAAHGRATVADVSSALRTIVGTSPTSTTPTILAARQEMQKWRLLALEPSAMRRPDRFHAPSQITSSGGHLPATVFRLAQEAEEEGADPEAVYASIAAKLARLVAISGVRVDKDDVRQLLVLQVRERSGDWLPAASLSDGTLRFLTLAALTADYRERGLICLEEPENGIHPARMYDMVELLRELAVDPEHKPGEDNPLRQIIVATHSPTFVQLQDPNDLLFAMQAAVRGEHGGPLSTLRCLPLSNTWRSKGGNPSVDWATVIAYLLAPPEARLELPPAIAALA